MLKRTRDLEHKVKGLRHSPREVFAYVSIHGYRQLCQQAEFNHREFASAITEGQGKRVATIPNSRDLIKNKAANRIKNILIFFYRVVN